MNETPKRKVRKNRMPTEEFKSSMGEFCYRFAKALTIVPVLVMVISVILYYVGSSRVSRIGEYV